MKDLPVFCAIVAPPKGPLRSPRSSHAFVYRAGIGLAGTHITCDAAGFASDLIFLSHARALGPRGASRLAGARAGRRQVVATETTLRLLGEAGATLRSRTLPAAFGRPFNLGGHRIELVPSGYLPGSAALLCEAQGRPLYYLGACAPEALVPGLGPAEVRAADALCIDARFGHPRLVFPPRRQVLADIRGFAQASLREGRTPVLLVSAVGVLPALAWELLGAGLAPRAHPRLARELARLHEVCDAIPPVGRAGRQPREGEVWLWPAEARHARTLPPPSSLRLALVTGAPNGSELLAEVRGDAVFALTTLPNHAEILSVLGACGAREVALVNGDSDELVADLRGRGLDAYSLGPPRQMTLVG